MERRKETVKEIFTAYLLKNGYRKTPERFAILDEIYSHTGHFDADYLFKAMTAKKYRVCRATIYNTMQLLLDCHLIVRHQFNDNTVQYERVYNHGQHEHLICLKCGAVEECSDMHLKEIMKNIEGKYNFSVHHHLLYIYGLCRNCKDREEMC